MNFLNFLTSDGGNTYFYAKTEKKTHVHKNGFHSMKPETNTVALPTYFTLDTPEKQVTELSKLYT